VDYKTGQPPKAATPNLGYIYQLAIYKHAMEQRFGKAVRSVALHFLQNLQDYSLPTDKDYYQEAVALCREIYLKYREEDFACSVDVCTYCPYNYLCTKK
jgi:CRISPR/Cas system-associated exonuclease Cas4 (RecB family)